MSFGLVFWILMLICLVFGFYSHWPLSQSNSRPFTMNLFLFVLLLLLGWKVFGAPLHQ